MDHKDSKNIVDKFEENVKKAHTVLENAKEETLFNNWSMTVGGNVAMAPMPRIQVVRGFLFNHLYHHRGELVAHLRASGNKVPGLYGPTYEESLAMQAN